MTQFIRSLTGDTRRALARRDVVFDCQLPTLSRIELGSWVRHAADRRRIEQHVERTVLKNGVRGAAMPMLCGFLEAPSVRRANNVIQVRAYRNRIPWNRVSRNPGMLVRAFQRCPDRHR